MLNYQILTQRGRVLSKTYYNYTIKNGVKHANF